MATTTTTTQSTAKAAASSIWRLACGGVSLISLLLVHQPWLLLLPMVGFGLTWASAQSIPYAILTYAIPNQQRGIYQGIFNFFIVLPEIAIALGFGWVMEHWLHDNRLMAVVLGGVFLIVAALIMPFVRVPEQATEQVSDQVTDQLTDQVQTDAADSNANGSTDSDQVGEPVAS